MDKITVRIDADLEDLIPGYLNNRRNDVKDIEKYIQESDWELVRRISHRMKGSGGGYGFDGITEIGAAMEQAAVLQDVVEVRRQNKMLEEYLSRVEIIYVQL